MLSEIDSKHFHLLLPFFSQIRRPKCHDLESSDITFPVRKLRKLNKYIMIKSFVESVTFFSMISQKNFIIRIHKS